MTPNPVRSAKQFFFLLCPVLGSFVLLAGRRGELLRSVRGCYRAVCGPWLPAICREVRPAVEWSPMGHQAATDGSQDVTFTAAATECGAEKARIWRLLAQSLRAGCGRGAAGCGRAAAGSARGEPPSAPGRRRPQPPRQPPVQRVRAPARELRHHAGRLARLGARLHQAAQGIQAEAPRAPAPAPAPPPARRRHHQHHLPMRRRVRISLGQLHRAPAHHLLVHLRQLPADRHLRAPGRPRPAPPASPAPAAATRTPRRPAAAPNSRAQLALLARQEAGEAPRPRRQPPTPPARSIAADGPGSTSTGSPAATQPAPARSRDPTPAASRRPTRAPRPSPARIRATSSAARACSLCSW